MRKGAIVISETVLVAFGVIISFVLLGTFGSMIFSGQSEAADVSALALVAKDIAWRIDDVAAEAGGVALVYNMPKGINADIHVDYKRVEVAADGKSYAAPFQALTHTKPYVLKNTQYICIVKNQDDMRISLSKDKCICNTADKRCDPACVVSDDCDPACNVDGVEDMVCDRRCSKEGDGICDMDCFTNEKDMVNEAMDCIDDLNYDENGYKKSVGEDRICDADSHNVVDYICDIDCQNNDTSFWGICDPDCSKYGMYLDAGVYFSQDGFCDLDCGYVEIGSGIKKLYDDGVCDLDCLATPGVCDPDCGTLDEDCDITCDPETYSLLPQSHWKVHHVDNEELDTREKRYAYKAFDGIIETLWSTEWGPPGPTSAIPHEIQIDLGDEYFLCGFRYLPRQNNNEGTWQENGAIADYEFYVSNDGTDWGLPIATGTFATDKTEKEILFDKGKEGRYVRLRALSEVNGKPWTTVSELNLIGTDIDGCLAYEICNNKDDDCDNQIDETCDEDNDGYCDCDIGFEYGSDLTVCPNTDTGTDYSWYNSCDCNDDSQDINPNAEDISDDGVDNNCDGDDCNAGNTDHSVLPQNHWKVIDFDSEELNSPTSSNATKSFDGVEETCWHTEWVLTEPDPVHSHHIQIDLGKTYFIDGFRYLAPQYAAHWENGAINGYEFYVSDDLSDWGDAVASGNLLETQDEQEVLFTGKTGRYIQLVAKSGFNSRPWTSMSELNVLGHDMCDEVLPEVVSEATGPLTVHPTNPRYFADGDGEAIYLTGSHTWYVFQDWSSSNWDTFVFDDFVNLLKTNNHNFVRGWLCRSTHIPWGVGNSVDIHMYKRTGPGNAWDGKPKFDLYQFNQEYFDMVRERVIIMGENGIYVSMMMFWDTARLPDAHWDSHVYNKNNNIYGINGDFNSETGGMEIYNFDALTDPNYPEGQDILYLHEAFVRKMIDTLGDLDNVLWEVGNELDHPDSLSFHTHFIDYIRDYELTKSKQHPVGFTAMVSGGGGEVINNIILNSDADWMSPAKIAHNYDVFSISANDGTMVSLADTDHLGNINIYRESPLGDKERDYRDWVWKCFTRGHNPILMDNPLSPSLLPHYQALPAARRYMGDAHTYAQRVDLALMTPQNSLSSTEHCLANPGSQYIVYQPDSGSFTVNLEAGTYNYEWFNPASGSVEGISTITVGDGNQDFNPPFIGDAVLYLDIQADLPVLEKLVVSPDGYYLQTASGDPFMWISETLWYLVQRTTQDDVEYLLDRLAGITDPDLGGTTVVKTTIAMKLGGAYESGDLKNPVNAYGYQAFNGGNVPDFNSPNIVADEYDYWDHLDFIVRETKERGLYLTLTPQWSDAYVHGRYNTNMINAATAKFYGEWLGNRYKNENHIIWMLGGDGNNPEEEGTKAFYRAQAEGILKGMTGCTNCPAYNENSILWDEVMMIYHGDYFSRASQYWDSNEKWMDLDGVYSGRFQVITDAYNQPNPRPTVETEGYGYWICTEEQLSRQRTHHYVHYLSGGKGPEYMNDYLWNFEDGWKARLSIPERVQITIMKSTMNSVAWHKLVPDQGIILSANSFSDDDFLKTIISARSSDEDFIMVFFSAFSTGSAEIDLSDITSHACARGTWINPINGNTQDAGSHQNTDDPVFTIPATWTDAVLKLEGESCP